MSSFLKLIIKETDAKPCCFHTFNVPEELKSKYIAGQYLNLRLTLDGKEIRRIRFALLQKVVNYVLQ
jgi:ring-1,2-phenylacetyl-CoA epoxidase subunit PaaE